MIHESIAINLGPIWKKKNEIGTHTGGHRNNDPAQKFKDTRRGEQNNFETSTRWRLRQICEELEHAYYDVDGGQ